MSQPWLGSVLEEQSVTEAFMFPAQYDPAKPAALMVFQDGIGYMGTTTPIIVQHQTNARLNTQIESLRSQLALVRL